MKKIVLISIVAFVLFISIGVFIQLRQQKTEKFEFDKPSEVVKKYFESWDKKNWVEMYASISDGFKKIEPTAKTLSDFREYAISQNTGNIGILSINEKSNDGKTAVVEYSVEFTLSDGSKNKFADSFTLKYRDGDIIKGWKLIHPYGDKIGSS